MADTRMAGTHMQAPIHARNPHTSRAAKEIEHERRHASKRQQGSEYASQAHTTRGPRSRLRWHESAGTREPARAAVAASNMHTYQTKRHSAHIDSIHGPRPARARARTALGARVFVGIGGGREMV
jgi:hypothetical protein